MSDDKQKTGEQDRGRVNSHESYEVEELHRKYPHLIHQTVAAAVKKYGPLRKDIEAYLDKLPKK